MSNFLVVDWDYFFSNPMDGGDFETQNLLLYDWGHIETQFNIDYIWQTRAESFLRHGVELPQTSGWRGFWDRFSFAPDTVLEYADSNMHSGAMRPAEGDAFDSVWLFDAHHDSGYHARSVKEFLDRGSYDCEDWMILHSLRGSELHVRYPQWKVHALTAEPAPAVPVDRAVDDGAPLDVVFDRVYLCRSGAWVPSWCDPDFERFVLSFPGDVYEIEQHYAMMRAFDLEEVQRQVEVMDAMMKQMREGRTPS